MVQLGVLFVTLGCTKPLTRAGPNRNQTVVRASSIPHLETVPEHTKEGSQDYEHGKCFGLPGYWTEGVGRGWYASRTKDRDARFARCRDKIPSKSEPLPSPLGKEVFDQRISIPTCHFRFEPWK